MAKARISTVSVFEKRMLSEKEALEYLGIGRSTCRKYCEQIGAIKHIGSRRLYDRNVIDAHMDMKEAK